MKHRLILLFAALVIISLPQQTFSRDDRPMFPIGEELATPAAQNKLQGIEFYFGNQEHPKILQDFGEVGTNKKLTLSTNQTNRPANGCFYPYC
jgi:hypothetical protein